MNRAPISEVDLTHPEVFDDPHHTYDGLRAHAPVHWNPSLRGWVLTRHADVKAALKDPRLSVEKLEPFADRAGGDPHGDVRALAEVLADWMVFKDPPRHAELRRAMQNAFMARDIPVLQPLVQESVDRQLESIEPFAGDARGIDFVHAFAYPLPADVIARLFGLPPDEAETIKQWSGDLGRFVLGGAPSDDKYRKAAQAVRAMTARFAALVEAHREHPVDDFTSLLIRDGAHLSDAEVVHTLTLVLFAGHETTANLIASALLTLIRNPGLQAELRATPGRVEAAVEEFLRLDGPVQMVYRLAKEDVEYGGVSIPSGDRLHLVLNAANRDPLEFDRAGEIDLQRRRFRHVSFGPGTHMCLGAPLARLVARVALEGLLHRFEGFCLTRDEVTWRRELIIHGPTSLPVRYERVA